MKVILLQDVAKIGKKHSIVEVPDGYGMNKLIPKGMAKPATAQNIKQITRQQQDKASERVQENELFTKLCELTTDTAIVVQAKANDDGALYETIKKEAIQDSLATMTNLTVTLGWIEIDTPIKTVGTHTIGLSCDGVRIEREVQVEAA